MNKELKKQLLTSSIVLTATTVSLMTSLGIAKDLKDTIKYDCLKSEVVEEYRQSPEFADIYYQELSQLTNEFRNEKISFDEWYQETNKLKKDSHVKAVIREKSTPEISEEFEDLSNKHSGHLVSLMLNCAGFVTSAVAGSFMLTKQKNKNKEPETEIDNEQVLEN